MSDTTTSVNGQFDIIAFCCEHCAYAAADLAGSLRMQYPAAIKVVRLPCTGKLDALMILQALEAGADGVMVEG
jgi:coenzyme F420-reducing hydrogenase delta subunit